MPYEEIYFQRLEDDIESSYVSKSRKKILTTKDMVD